MRSSDEDLTYICDIFLEKGMNAHGQVLVSSNKLLNWCVNVGQIIHLVHENSQRAKESIYKCQVARSFDMHLNSILSVCHEIVLH